MSADERPIETAGPTARLRRWPSIDDQLTLSLIREPRSRFPTHPEIQPRIPIWVWRVLEVVALCVALALIVVLLLWPRRGLLAWWLFVLPCLPLSWMLAPGLWRNICPMATVNQIPRLLGVTQTRRLPPWLRKHGYLLQFLFYFAAISTRAPVFDHSGRALAVLMALALLGALGGGLLFAGKSGWCGSFCPLMPVQKLYGQTPAVVVPNAHCQPCVGCIKNCYDFNPRVATVADLNDEDAQWVSYRKIFAGMFPGFVFAFFAIPSAPIASPPDPHLDLLRFYALTAAAMLLSLGAFYLLEAFLPFLTTTVLVAFFGALALNLHNILRFTTAFNFHKPVWLRVIEGTCVFLVTVLFLVRTWRQERLIDEEIDRGGLGMIARPASAAGSVLRAAGEGHEVDFVDGPTIAAAAGTSLLEVAERSELPIEAGCRMGVCGADPITIVEGASGLSPKTSQESDTLARLGVDRDDVRLACCARVTGAVRVSLAVERTAPSTAYPKPALTAAGKRVLVIGNGIAGITAADYIRRRDETCTITVIADEPHLLYNRMGLTRLIYGRSGLRGLQLLPDDWYVANRIECLLNTQAVALDLAERRVTLGTGEHLGYDELVLATGSTAYLPELPGIDLPGVFALRTADDGVAIRAFAQRHQCRSAVVLGGGLLGLETSRGLDQMGVHTTILELGTRLLHRQLDARASSLLAVYMSALGFDLVVEASAAAIEGTNRATAILLKDGRRIPLDLLVVSAGIAPRVELAAGAGLPVRRGVLVNDRMQTSSPHVYAAGDVAQFEGVITGLWTTAVEQAEVAARNICGEEAAYRGQERTTILKGIGLDVVSLGIVEAAEDDVVVVEDRGDAEIHYSKLLLRGGRLVGAIVVGDPGLAGALTAAVRLGLPLDRARAEALLQDATTLEGALVAAS